MVVKVRFVRRPVAAMNRSEFLSVDARSSVRRRLYIRMS
jgi:hypothetical protein